MIRNPFPAGAPVVTYSRDSGGDEQDRSVDQQLAAYQAFADEHRLVIVQNFADRARPGSTTVGRDGFEAMIAYMHTHGHKSQMPVAGVLLWKHNRFARNLDESQFYKADLRRRGFTLHFLADDIPDAGSATPIFEALLEWKAQQDLKDISTDAARGLMSLVTTRKPDGTYEGFSPGTPPMGFMREMVKHGVKRSGAVRMASRWVPDPATWDRCRQAWEMRAAGASLRAVHDATHLYKSVNCMSTFFANEIYRGVYVYSGQRLEGFVPAMVTQEQWDAVQKLRQPKPKQTTRWDDRTHPRQAYSHHLLSGLCTCARCGQALMGNSVKGWRFYICKGKHKGGSCTLPRIGAKLLDELVAMDAADQILKPAQLSAMLELSLAGMRERKEDRKNASRDIRRQIQAANQASQRLIRMAELGSGALDSIKARLDELDMRRKTLERQLTEASVDYDALQRPSEAQLEAFSGMMRQKLLSGDPHLVKPLLRMLVTRVEVDEFSATVHYSFPLQASAGGGFSMGMESAPMGALLISIVRRIAFHRWRRTGISGLKSRVVPHGEHRLPL